MARACGHPWNFSSQQELTGNILARDPPSTDHKEAFMSFGKGALLWLIGIPLPIILLLAIFMHH